MELWLSTRQVEGLLTLGSNLVVRVVAVARTAQTIANGASNCLLHHILASSLLLF